MKFTRAMIEALDKCRIIALGSVGVDYVDVAAATEKGIPVTNCPDTFIEEVADHAMMLLLATHRRAHRAGPHGARGPLDRRAAAAAARFRA